MAQLRSSHSPPSCFGSPRRRVPPHAGGLSSVGCLWATSRRPPPVARCPRHSRRRQDGHRRPTARTSTSRRAAATRSPCSRATRAGRLVQAPASRAATRTITGVVTSDGCSLATARRRCAQSADRGHGRSPTGKNVYVSTFTGCVLELRARRGRHPDARAGRSHRCTASTRVDSASPPRGVAETTRPLRRQPGLDMAASSMTRRAITSGGATHGRSGDTADRSVRRDQRLLQRTVPTIGSPWTSSSARTATGLSSPAARSVTSPRSTRNTTTGRIEPGPPPPDGCIEPAAARLTPGAGAD